MPEYIIHQVEMVVKTMNETAKKVRVEKQGDNQYVCSVAFENGKNERYYPIANEETAELYQKYMNLAKDTPNVYFCGRLGDYKYYDMDKAIARCIELTKGLK